MQLLETFKNILRIPDLRKKIGFTLLAIFIYRIGGHIPTPGINSQVLAEFFAQSKNTLLGLYDMFVGGAMGKSLIQPVKDAVLKFHSGPIVKAGDEALATDDRSAPVLAAPPTVPTRPSTKPSAP